MKGKRGWGNAGCRYWRLMGQPSKIWHGLEPRDSVVFMLFPSSFLFFFFFLFIKLLTCRNQTVSMTQILFFFFFLKTIDTANNVRAPTCRLRRAPSMWFRRNLRFLRVEFWLVLVMTYQNWYQIWASLITPGVLHIIRGKILFCDYPPLFFFNYFF